MQFELRSFIGLLSVISDHPFNLLDFIECPFQLTRGITLDVKVSSCITRAL